MRLHGNDELDGIYLNYAPREVASIIVSSGNRADVMVRCSKVGVYHLVSRPVVGSLASINFELGPPLVGYDPLFQGNIADIVVSDTDASRDPLASLPPFVPERPPMLLNTSDIDVSDEQFRFKDYDLQMSAQPSVLLEPAQICFLNGGLFNESQAYFDTTLDSLNEFRITGVIQHPFHQHINSFQIHSLDGNIPDIYNGAR